MHSPQDKHSVAPPPDAKRRLGAEPREPASEGEAPHLPPCVSLDLEVAPNDGCIRALAAIRPDTGGRLVWSGGGLSDALAELDKFARGASFVLGHNLIEFDLPQLAAVKPDLDLLKLPAVDTLRISPLAFPRHPYHRLVKHYQDGGLKRGQINNPELDARLALEVFDDERKALMGTPPDLVAAWHWLTTPDPEYADRAVDAFFAELRGASRPSSTEARAAIHRRLGNSACSLQTRALMTTETKPDWPLAYALAWLSVAGGNSVMPPWVQHQFPEAGRLVRRLRDTACTDPGCEWCRERHDARKELNHWFRFPSYRPDPADNRGRSLQQAIVEEAMAGKHALGVLPTGTGKSLCYQIPALSRYDKTGALAVVISPLVALMRDQVLGLEKRGIGACVTVNGLLSMPERADALDRVRLGGAGILLISPEQLRSRSVRRALDQREIGSWVIDEAHCLSRWGHDFRPDYRYVGRFIREKARDGAPPPVLCLTATAKPDVVEDIKRHFRDELGIALTVFDGGTERTNLTFEVIPTSEGEKFGHIQQVLSSYLPPDTREGAIVYCATRRQSEDVAEFLRSKQVAADHFHGGLPPETKKDVQRRFVDGKLRVIAATNAFGMGIDKPDVRLVIHADIPGSLENYLQEAGRAGRDQASARCVLLYSAEDVERQFGMSAHSRLTRREIHGILRALRNLDRRHRRKQVRRGEVVATAGEILAEDDEKAFERDSNTDDTRVKTAVAWLEEARLLTREENLVQVFPSSLRVSSVDEAATKLKRASTLADTYRKQLLRIAERLIESDADEGVTTDELMGVAGLGPEALRAALYDLEQLGIASNDTAITAFVHVGVEHASAKRREEAEALESALISLMRELAPDMGKGDRHSLHLRVASQMLQDQGLSDPLPERLWRIVRGIANDGREEGGSGGSLSVRKRDPETVQVTLNRGWEALAETADRRREGAKLVLQHLISCLPSGTRGTDLLAETTLGKLRKAIESDVVIKSRVRDTAKLLDRALLWLHELDVIHLNKGMAVFRPAMTIHLEQLERRGFAKSDFTPLALHYQGKVLQIHVMVEFAKRGLAAMSEALRLAMDYFALKEDAFLARWLPGRDKEIGRETTPESWRAIVEHLKNPIQQRIVADDREQTNVLVLAGPGSGKTRALVHRIAYLVRVRRENARSILALAYNRHAAVEIRRRLAGLIGDDARGITVLTCHSLAMRLTGSSFRGRAEQPDDQMFRDVMLRAVALLRGEGLPAEEADDQRDRLLAGFRWILVDEYQDIGAEQYDLISALAGRTLADEHGKLTLFAVGDDDQNIYAFNGTSVEFIRRFKQDYGPSPQYLVENYRSTRHIVEAANAVIEPARERMKAGHPIRIDRARKKHSPGGEWERLDPVSRGRVQILPAGHDPVSQARSVMAEFQRLATLATDWDWSRCAVIAREWRYLDPVRAVCDVLEIPSQMGNEEIPNFWRLRETGEFLEWMRAREPCIVDSETLRSWLQSRPIDPWHDLLRQAVEEHALETAGGETPVAHFTEWLAEWGRDIRRRQHGMLLLTGHRAKGLEFDHVAVLDGGWNRIGAGEGSDEPRRLYYVAMTRARETLTLMRMEDRHGLQEALYREPSAVWRRPVNLPPGSAAFEYRHMRASLQHVDLGFAGRQPSGRPVHRAIAALSPQDLLEPRVVAGGTWELLDHNGTVVGRLSKSFKPPPGMRCRAAEVFAIVGWSRDASEPQYRDSARCEAWEVVVPELVFEPDAQSGPVRKTE